MIHCWAEVRHERCVFAAEATVQSDQAYFPLSRGVPRVDDRRVVSGIIYVIRNGLQWKDAPRGYGPPKTLYNRFIRWSRGELRPAAFFLIE